MTDSTSSASEAKATKKPDKPYPEFPLFAHATKRWAKKIKGKTHYFGPWDDPMGALERFEKTIHAIRTGRAIVEDNSGLSVENMADAYLADKENLVK